MSHGNKSDSYEAETSYAGLVQIVNGSWLDLDSIWIKNGGTRATPMPSQPPTTTTNSLAKLTLV